MHKEAINIKNYLPHRPPMLMVDDIIAIDEKEVITTFKVKETNIFLKNGNFAETGLIENAAQTCSAIVAQPLFVDERNFFRKDLKLIGFISAIKNLKVHHLPKVGSMLKTKAILGSRYDTDEFAICTMICTTFFEKKILFEAEINLFIQEEKP